MEHPFNLDKYEHELIFGNCKAEVKKSTEWQIKSVASPKGKIQYKSLDTKTASVTKKGKVVGKKKGKTKIRVSCNGLVRYCKITVK